MQSKQQMGKREFRAPPGYGRLTETHQVDPQSGSGLESGTFFVHEYERGGKVGNLVLRGAGGQLQYAFVWQVQNGRVTPQGSTLLYQTRPDRKKGQSWDSEDFLAKRVDIYRGKQGGLFAITPCGLVTLQDPKPVREPNARGGFNMDAFKVAVAKDKQAFEARRASRNSTAPASAKTVDSELERTALGVVTTRTAAGTPADWNLVVDDLATMGFNRDRAEDALDRLVDTGQLEQPTLMTLRIGDAASEPAPAGHDEPDGDAGQCPSDGDSAPEEHAASSVEAA